ncbi:hypothetical protein SAMN07250955_1252 [Arboricoccus pini]|uniref:Uncharacterized protein n=1 Tax=Arboricoccus pini TaxID=1963835 RepID=A0A212S465_9PROT|nr:hypothetical protein SAMN07250955_1252 [Arboricoccus pini]
MNNANKSLSQPNPDKIVWNKSVEDCDVLDKPKLQTFRDKRCLWIGWLSGEDPSSIERQLREMCLNYVIFRMLNEALRLIIRDNTRSPLRDPSLFAFITNGFLASQILCIRRLNEKNNKNPNKEVVSIKRLVEDIFRICIYLPEKVLWDIMGRLLTQSRNVACRKQRLPISLPTLERQSKVS